MIQKIKPNLHKITFTAFGSIVYLVQLRRQNILIDTSSAQNKEELVSALEELNIKPSEIHKVILTHNHWDHTGNIDLFSHAEIYGDKKDFSEKEVLNINTLQIPEFKIIPTPGHTKGSLCLLYNDVLFSGDTLFFNGIGRTDFKESSPQDMESSLELLDKLNYKILCPGH